MKYILCFLFFSTAIAQAGEMKCARFMRVSSNGQGRYVEDSAGKVILINPEYRASVDGTQQGTIVKPISEAAENAMSALDSNGTIEFGGTEIVEGKELRPTLLAFKVIKIINKSCNQ